MEQIYKEVDFEKYCALCTYKKVNEKDYPCNECLEEENNLYSSKPVKFEEKIR